MPGGPDDDVCIPSFAAHVACDVWDGHDKGVLECCTRHTACEKLLVWRHTFTEGVPDEDGVILPRTINDLRVHQIVSESGLGDLSALMFPHIDAPLLSAFVERWQPDTNTFHMPFGEMTIMLHDVAHILGLRIDGKVVADNSVIGDDLGDVSELLGVPVKALHTENIYVSGGVKSQAVFDLCWRAADRVPETQAIGYMFMTLGSTIFVDKSGSRLRPSVIKELVKEDEVHEYAWGAATLAYLYRELGIASRKECKKLAGCLTLLQAWIYEYFPAFRPHREQRTLRDDEPRCRQWIVRIEPRDQERLVMFRNRLERMTAEEVELHPRTMFTGCIAYHSIVEPYLSYRCVRQLGYVQDIPPRIPRPLRACRPRDPNKYILQFAEGTAKEQWDGFPLTNILNCTLLPFCHYNGIATPEYLSWYMKHSHPYVVNDRVFVPPAGPDLTMHEHRIARFLEKLEILFNPILDKLPSPHFDEVRHRLQELRLEVIQFEIIVGKRCQGPPAWPPSWQH